LFTKSKENNFKILDLPANRTTYQVSSLKIISKFKEHNESIADLTTGIVTFKKCNSVINFKNVKKLLRQKFKIKYPSIKIKNIEITSTSPLPAKLSFYKLKDIDLAQNDYRSASGTFGVIYKKGMETKKIYLRYMIDANIFVFKASYNLRNGKILNPDDYERVEIKFDKLPLHVISGKIKKDYIIKGYIRKGLILSTNNLKIKKNLLKNSYVKAILEDENMILEVDARILNDANIGDIVKIRTTNGKILRAKIISLKTAKIIE
jgi:flagella basal body P-ring formation protein FlgA